MSDTKIKEYSAIEAGIGKLRATYKTVPDCHSEKGLDLCKKNYRDIRKVETAIEKRRKDINEEAQERIKLVNSEAKRVTALVQEISGPFKIARDKRIADLELEEEKRVAGIHEEIRNLKCFIGEAHETDSEGVSSLIECVKLIDCSISFDEFTQEAVKTQKEVLDHLGSILQSKLTTEAAERDRAAAEERQRELDIQERINNIRMIPTSLFGRSSADLTEKREELAVKIVSSSEFGDRGIEANAARELAIDHLTNMIDQADIIEKATIKRDEEARESADAIEDEKEGADTPIIREESQKPTNSSTGEPLDNIDEDTEQAHRAKIHKAAKMSLLNFFDDKTATEIVALIKDGEIANVTINY